MTSLSRYVKRVLIKAVVIPLIISIAFGVTFILMLPNIKASLPNGSNIESTQAISEVQGNE